MTDDTFTEPEEASDNWIDVRMTNPEEGEWDVDFVVVEGRVNYVDLRIRPDLLTAFVDCLIEDTGKEQATRTLTEIAERKGLDLSAKTEDD